MPDSFVHLHTHSCYSLLDGLARIDDLLQATVAAGMPALALTDHGVMFGAVEFYSKAKELGVKPILGCEVYVADRPLTERGGSDAQNFHLSLLAENEVGYRNLVRLTTEAHLRGFYRKPRVDHALLQEHAEGIICLSGCASGELAGRILKGQMAEAEALADWYRQLFPGRYFLELQDHDLEIQKTINSGVTEIARRLGLPLVATNDVHYTYARQAQAQEILVCIQTQTTLDDPKRMRMGTQEFYLKSPDQMRALFEGFPDAIANTLEIADRCNLELAFGRPHLPRFNAPDGRTPEAHLRALCELGLEQRYAVSDDSIRQRLEYELSVISSTGLVDYYLLVHDVIHFARSRGIAVGPGRGSGAASLVAYCLRMTNIDPIANGLWFERFLNPERISMPDFDLDFADDRRDEIIHYVTEKYGRDHVAQIITFGTLGPRAGVRDVGRVMGMPYGDIDRVAKLVPFMCNKVSRAKEEVPELQQLCDGDPAMRRLLDTVEDMEGVARHASTHAAGVVISRDPLIEHVPLYKVPKSELVTTQYAMSSVEKIGLLKMDFLGLRTLTVLERARGFIRESTGQDLNIEDIPLEDRSIYELLSRGDTFGVFQLDGAGMRKAIAQVRPSEFRHLVALNALYRPGPMEHIDKFAARKNGQLPVTYDHPALAEVLEETYGIVVYQEQVMQLFSLVAGYTLGEADLVRRAMGKKKPEELAKHREAFTQRAGARGTSADTARHLWDIVEPFAGYAFNKAHAAAYTVITCQTAYLKANYPREFMAGLLSAEKENAERVAEAMRECGLLGISVLQPDINQSELDFTLDDGSIRFGLSAVKHVGSGAIEAILLERRENGPFASLEDLARRIDWGAVNKRVLDSLARCGALDSLGVERNRILASLDRIVSFGTQMQRARQAGQVSLFGEVEQQEASMQLAVAEAATLEEKVAWEEELLGVAISRHPVADAAASFQAADAVPVGVVTSDHHNSDLSVGGLIRGLRSFSTKSGKPMATFQLTDLRTSLEVIVFSRTYDLNQPRLVDGSIVVVDGRLDASDGRVRLVAEAVWPLEDAAGRPRPDARRNGRRNGAERRNGHGNGAGNGNGHGPGAPEGTPGGGWRLTVEIVRSPDREADMRLILELYAALQRFRGNDEVEVMVRQGTKLTSIPLPSRAVGVCEELERELQRLVGPAYRVVAIGVSA